VRENLLLLPLKIILWPFLVTVTVVGLLQLLKLYGGQGSSVGIVTELRAGRSGVESWWGQDFPPIQTCPGACPALCKMGTRSFSGVKCGRGVLLTTLPLLVPRSWSSRAIPLSPSGPHRASNRNIFFYPFHSFFIMVIDDLFGMCIILVQNILLEVSASFYCTINIYIYIDLFFLFCTDFFIELDQYCGPLTLHSSLNDLVRYVRVGIQRLKDM